ncbi:hypothetical protein ACTZWT_10220 [Rhodopseudomonas sp. NSM]|uniref:hypothetical protein n=1 Tax=Rhodopseudomonas sp. NSM TaxID=3457630 RepID=UPI00403621FA
MSSLTKIFSQVDLEGSVAALASEMRKRTSSDRFPWDGWPSLTELEPLFLAPDDQRWPYWKGYDEWALYIEGLDGTDGLPDVDQGKVYLTMTGTPDFGVMLSYEKWDGRTMQSQDCFSKGDMSRIREWLRTLHDDLRPIGLFIPYAQAWPAVKEFMERDGELPTSIEWVDAEALPPNTFRFPGFFRPGPEPRVLREEDINDESPDGSDPFKSLRG